MIDARGKVQDKLRQALKEGTLTLPPEYAAHLPQVKEVLRQVAGQIDIKNADERVTVKTRQAVLQSAEFQALWERNKHKPTYRENLDNEKLIEDFVKDIAGEIGSESCQEKVCLY